MRNVLFGNVGAVVGELSANGHNKIVDHENQNQYDFKQFIAQKIKFIKSIKEKKYLTKTKLMDIQHYFNDEIYDIELHKENLKNNIWNVEKEFRNAKKYNYKNYVQN